MSSSPQHQQEPTPVFLERMRKFDPADVRIVVTNLAAKLQPYLGGTDDARRTVRSDLLRAHRQPCDIEECYAVLWRALPYITPDDSQRYSLPVTTPIWKFLIDQAQQLGYISDNPQHPTIPSTSHRRRRFSLRWPWRRRSSTERKEADWAEDIGDSVGDYLASRSTAGSSNSGGSGGSWWDDWFGGSASSGGGGSWFDDLF